MKKLVCLGLIVFSIFTLSGCRSLPMYHILERNAMSSFDSDIPAVTGIDQINTGNWSIVNDARMSSAGFVVVRRDNPQWGVYSMALDKVIVEFSADITFIDTFWDWVSGGYIEVQYDNGDIAVYDAMGNVVLPRATYLDYDVTGRIIVEDGENVFVEEVDILTDAGWETTVYRVDTETGEREVHEEADQFDVGDAYDDAPRVDLTDIGLENHYRIVQDNRVSVFDARRDRQVSSFMLPDVGNRRYFDGVLFYQMERIVDAGGRNHSYIDPATGNAVLLETFAIDLKNGKVNRLNVDYRIDNIFGTLVDDENINRFLYARVTRVANRTLEVEYTRNVIIDSKGKIIHDLMGMDLNNLLILTEDRIWNVNTDTILNRDLEYLFSGDIRQYAPGEQLLVIRHDNGLQGLVDLDGKVVIPFIYAEIWGDMFYEGKTLARDNNNEWWIIDVDGSRTSIPGGPARLTNGLYLSYDAATERVHIRDFTAASIRNIDVPAVGALESNTYAIETPFFTSTVVRVRQEFNTWNANDYAYFRVRYEE